LIAGVAAVVIAFAAYEAELLVLAAAACCGLLVVLAWPIPASFILILALATGVAVILDSVPEEISMARSALALAGTIISAFVFVAIVAAFSRARRQQWQLIAVRVLGSWITAGALLVLALRLSR
jgi:hypothetical protein